jgi:hypothetical protein
MHKGQRYTNGIETYKIKAVSRTGIKVTTERESDGAEVVFDWAASRGFIQRYTSTVSLGILVKA